MQIKRKGLKVLNIHKRLKNLRLNPPNSKTILSQRELAKKMGISYSRICNLECDTDEDTIPSLNDLLAYHSYFKVSMEYLLCLTDEPYVDLTYKNLLEDTGITYASFKNLKLVINNNRSNTSTSLFEKRKKVLVLNKLLSSEYLSPLLDVLYEFFTIDDTDIDKLDIQSIDKNMNFVAINKRGLFISKYRGIIFKLIESIKCSFKLSNENYKSLSVCDSNKSFMLLVDEYEKNKNNKSFKKTSDIFSKEFIKKFHGNDYLPTNPQLISLHSEEEDNGKKNETTK